MGEMVMPDNLKIEPDSWNAWSHKILADLEKIDISINELYNKINSLTIEIAILKTKAASSGALWGSLFGMGTALLVAFLSHLLGGK